MNSTTNTLFSNMPRPELEKEGTQPEKKWKILVVDDEKSVHDVTRLALDGFVYEDIGLEFLHAYTAVEAKEIMGVHGDIALAIIDVVMEEEHAGLDLVDYIRNEISNSIIRIVLRTGQPGQAPERKVYSSYDINDYKEKTELTSQKLYSTVFTSIRSYRDIKALHANRMGLERVIRSTAIIHKIKNLSEFINGVLEQLVAVLFLEEDSAYLTQGVTAIEGSTDGAIIVAGTGKYADHVGKNADEVLDTTDKQLVNKSREAKECLSEGFQYAIYFSPGEGTDDVLLFSSAQKLDEDSFHMLKLFCINVGVAYNNILLNKDIEQTQQDLLYMLGEAIETRSRETGSHVRRVAEYSRILAERYGLSEREQELIMHASPLHDFGKIGIPDKILHKDGKLDAEEWEIMQSHARLGEEMLARSDKELIQVASTIAGQHHEHWNGSGYPKGLSENDISIYGRITALADVFDALGSKRCYKDPWPLDKVMELIKAESGKHFDPSLVAILCENIDDMLSITEKFPD